MYALSYVSYYFQLWCTNALLMLIYILSYAWSDYPWQHCWQAVFGLFAEVMHEMRSPGRHVLQNNPVCWHGLQHPQHQICQLTMSACHLDPCWSFHSPGCLQFNYFTHENNVCSHVQSRMGFLDKLLLRLPIDLHSILGTAMQQSTRMGQAETHCKQWRISQSIHVLEL